MTNATYTGRDDLRILGREDLAKAGVEIESDLIFRSGVPAEVTSEVAEALANNAILFGSFHIEEPSVEEEAAPADPIPADPTEKPIEDAAPSTSKKTSKS